MKYYLEYAKWKYVRVVCVGGCCVYYMVGVCGGCVVGICMVCGGCVVCMCGLCVLGMVWCVWGGMLCVVY